MPKNLFMNINFQLKWTSHAAEHTDDFLIQNVDLENDILPTGFNEALTSLTIGESYTQKIQAKDLLGEGYSSDKVITFDSELFDGQFKNQYSPPMLYRFYPSAIAWQGLDASEKDYSPFRLIAKNQDEMRADRNHPLAKYYLTLTATLVEQCDKTDVSASKNNVVSKKDIARLITSKGPGMQAPFEFGDPIFFDDYPFKNKTTPDLTTPYLDSSASEEIAKLHSQLLPKHSKVLDVMSNGNSHLDVKYETGLLVGIGSNEKKLSENKRLDTYQVQDLNEISTLPFETNSFNDAICTMSIEYLTDPLVVMKEIARVVNPGGKCIITFSDNWIPDQATHLWGQLHPFERMQLVLEYFRKTELFHELNTFSKRGLPRPKDDKYIIEKPLSSPIFAVWATVK